MTPEDAKRWLEYQSMGIKPSRIKLQTVVFSDQSIAVPVEFLLDGYKLTLSPFIRGNRITGNLEGYLPAFNCEVISEQRVHRGGGNFDLHEALDRVLPLLGFDYRLPLEYHQWEEYNGEWLESVSASASMNTLMTHGDIPNKNIHQVVEAYEKLSIRADKRAKKATSLRTRLKEAIRLESSSKRYSFLSYYSILEIVSDDLASTKDCSSCDQIAKEIANYALSQKGSQRTKIYFLLHALPNTFLTEECVELADIRNDIAHGEQSVPHASFDLCKKMAFWASEAFALEVGNRI